MKKITIIGALLLLMTSCITQKKCFEKFPPTVISKDSVVLKDTTIYLSKNIYIPGDSAFIIDTFFMDYPENYSKTSTSSSGRVTATVQINKRVLKVDCKVDSLNMLIDSLKVKLQTKEAYHTEVKVVEKPVEKIPLWVWITFGCIAISFFVLPLLKR